MLPAEDAAGATAELRRLAERGGTKQVSMHIGRVTSPIYGDEWMPFWDVIDEIGDHRLVPPRADEGADDSASTIAPHGIFETSKEFIHQFLDPLVGMLGAGVLERAAERPARARRERARLAALGRAGDGLPLRAAGLDGRVLGAARRDRV